VNAAAKVRGIRPFAGKMEAKEKDSAGADEAKGHELFALYTDRTPFYAEVGGQPGDMGWAVCGKAKMRVVDSRALGEHIGFFAEGGAADIREGAEVQLALDEPRRRAIMRAHTTAHAMLAGLKQVLGDHINQAGSQIYPDRIRFDFSHFEAVSPAQLREMERIVNEIILADYRVWTQELPLVQAKREGVTAVFDEKYGETVRVVNIGEEGAQVSRELCGGTHMTRSAQAGSFVVVKEESVQSGIRRIEGAVGMEAMRFLATFREVSEELMRDFHVPLNEVTMTIGKVREELKETHEEMMNLRRAAMYNAIAPRVAQPEMVGDVALVVAGLEGATKDDVKTVVDRIARELAKAGKSPYAVMIVRKEEKSAGLTLKFSAELVPRGLKAGALVRELAKLMGGGGGGSDEFAEAGGKDASRMEEVINLLRSKLGAK
jgi:alanyl-tRNA synthetase